MGREENKPGLRTWHSFGALNGEYFSSDKQILILGIYLISEELMGSCGANGT